MKKVIVMAIAFMLVGCSVSPSLTTISATSSTEADSETKITIKQNFKWGK